LNDILKRRIKMKKSIKLFVLIAVIASIVMVQQAMAADLLIVSTKETQQAAQKWLSYLKTQDIYFTAVEPSDFEENKTAEYIIVYGSMDEGDAVKKIIKDALSTQELNWISKEGNGNLFFKSDVWGSGQQVMVITGSNRKVAEETRISYRDDWFDTLVEWFDLEVSEGLRAY
jgi:hypothetical protein